MCVCERERKRESVCVCARERERERACVCVRERERARVSVCVYVCERERPGGSWAGGGGSRSAASPGIRTCLELQVMDNVSVGRIRRRLAQDKASVSRG